MFDTTDCHVQWIIANKTSGAGSDYMSYTQLGYPAAFASEGNPSAGLLIGEYDPYVHTEQDTMHVDDEAGVFSLEVSVLGICFPTTNC